MQGFRSCIFNLFQSAFRPVSHHMDDMAHHIASLQTSSMFAEGCAAGCSQQNTLVVRGRPCYTLQHDGLGLQTAEMM